MNFILTKHIFPFEEPLIISNRFNFQLDNPRNENEIQLIKAHIEKSLNSPKEVYEYDHKYRLPIYLDDVSEDIITVEGIMNNFKEYYSKKEPYIHSFFEENKKLDILEQLAKMWVIARFDDEGEQEELQSILDKEPLEEGQRRLVILNEENPILKNSENLVSFCYLMSLLTNTEEFYFGRSFLLNHDITELEFPEVNKNINSAILYFGFNAFTPETKHEEDKWTSFYYLMNRLEELGRKIDDTIDDTNEAKILYIANLLKVISHEIKDVRYRLVTLVSIIELMLTHSPDFRRFNIEDSISKQFRLKTSIVVYQNDTTLELEWIKSRLKDMYNQRSNIAHGNFKSLNNYLNKEVKKSQEEDCSKQEILEGLIIDAYSFIRAIIEEYIKDREFIEFLKDN